MTKGQHDISIGKTFQGPVNGWFRGRFEALSKTIVATTWSQTRGHIGHDAIRSFDMQTIAVKL